MKLINSVNIVSKIYPFSGIIQLRVLGAIKLVRYSEMCSLYNNNNLIRSALTGKGKEH